MSTAGPLWQWWHSQVANVPVTGLCVLRAGAWVGMGDRLEQCLGRRWRWHTLRVRSGGSTAAARPRHHRRRACRLRAFVPTVRPAVSGSGYIQPGGPPCCTRMCTYKLRRDSTLDPLQAKRETSCQGCLWPSHVEGGESVHSQAGALEKAPGARRARRRDHASGPRCRPPPLCSPQRRRTAPCERTNANAPN